MHGEKEIRGQGVVRAHSLVCTEMLSFPTVHLADTAV
jgi:hypothetical protein